MNLKGKKILVTGGASFIGSNLVKGLLGRGAQVFIVDDLSTGKLENIQEYIDNDNVQFTQGDLRETNVTRTAVKGMDVVFHLAADHGGRGYIQLNQAATSVNLLMDSMVFFESHKAGVEKVVFASSGCVYPNAMQGDTTKEVYLNESMVTPPYDSDNLYGWAKLMGELSLKAYCKETTMRAASCRYFTAYGPRCLESHAVMAMIGRAFVKQSPFEIWGDGQQIRNWTYVDDIVEGTIRAAEMIDDGTAVNIGTTERISVLQAAKMITAYMNSPQEFKLLTDMPTGPLNRVADNSLAKQLLDWSPRVTFEEGLRKTIEWYVKSKNAEEVKDLLENKLLVR